MSDSKKGKIVWPRPTALPGMGPCGSCGEEVHHGSLHHVPRCSCGAVWVPFEKRETVGDSEGIHYLDSGERGVRVFCKMRQIGYGDTFAEAKGAAIEKAEQLFNAAFNVLELAKKELAAVVELQEQKG